MDVDMSVRSALVCRLFSPLVLVSGLVSAQDHGNEGLPDEPDLEPSASRALASDSEGIHPYLEYRKRVEVAQNVSPLDN